MPYHRVFQKLIDVASHHGSVQGQSSLQGGELAGDLGWLDKDKGGKRVDVCAVCCTARENLFHSNSMPLHGIPRLEERFFFAVRH